MDQLENLQNFITEWCEKQQNGQRIFTAALNRYQTLDRFEQLLEKLLDGLLYHESDLRIEEHYTDTTGFTDHVVALGVSARNGNVFR